MINDFFAIVFEHHFELTINHDEIDFNILILYSTWKSVRTLQTHAASRDQISYRDTKKVLFVSRLSSILQMDIN